MTSPAARHRQYHEGLRAAARAEAVAVSVPPEPPRAAPPPPFAVSLDEVAQFARPLRSLAADHQRTVLAHAAAAAAMPATPGRAAARPEDGPDASDYQLLLAALGADISRLRDIQSIEQRIALKRDLVGAYDDHVRAALDAARAEGKALEDEIVSTMLIWHLDIGDYAYALVLAEHVLRFGLALPAYVRRAAPTLIAEEVATAALKALGTGGTFDLGTIDAVISLTDGEDMPDIVRAKLFKARAKILMAMAAALTADPAVSAPAGAVHGALAAALAACQRAMQLDGAAGLKKDIERLTSAISRNAPPAGPESGPDSAGTGESESQADDPADTDLSGDDAA